MTTKVNRGQILFFLSAMVLVFIVVAYLSLEQFQRSEQARKMDEEIESIDIKSMDLFKTDVDFFNFEVTNSLFFQTGKSNYLNLHDSLFSASFSQIENLEKAKVFVVENLLEETRLSMLAYDSSFKRIVEQIKVSGFKDFGYEGKLRVFAHELENNNLLNPYELLTLRRHEKDYLLRNEKEYVDKFDNLSETLLKKYQANLKASELIKNYSAAFHELVHSSEKIGFHNQSGLKGDLNKKMTQLLKRLDELSSKAEIQTANTYNKGINIFMASIAIGFILCIILIAKISQRV